MDRITPAHQNTGLLVSKTPSGYGGGTDLRYSRSSTSTTLTGQTTFYVYAHPYIHYNWRLEHPFVDDVSDRSTAVFITYGHDFTNAQCYPGYRMEFSTDIAFATTRISRQN